MGVTMLACVLLFWSCVEVSLYYPRSAHNRLDIQKRFEDVMYKTTDQWNTVNDPHIVTTVTTTENGIVDIASIGITHDTKTVTALIKSTIASVDYVKVMGVSFSN